MVEIPAIYTIQTVHGGKMNVIGFDIGGTKSAVLIANASEDSIEFYGRKEISTTSDWRYILDTLCEQAFVMAEKHQIDLNAAAEEWRRTGTPTCIVGISCGGPLSVERKMILSPPNLPGWDEVPVVEYLEERLLIPAYMENDADACALAEWRYGAGKGFNNVIFLTFGTGLGAGLILGGRLYRGAAGMAGEVGHIRMEKDGPIGYGKKGSLEGFCSGGGIGRLAVQYVEDAKKYGRTPAFAADENTVITAKVVAEAAKNGDPDALQIYRISGGEFGRGLSILIDVLNPDCIVAGSIYTRCQPLLDEAMHAEIEKETLLQSRNACRIKPAELGEQIGDYGAVLAALYNC